MPIVVYRLGGRQKDASTLKQDYPNWRELIQGIYEMRNKFVHEGIEPDLTNDEIFDYMNVVLTLQEAIDTYIDAEYS